MLFVLVCGLYLLLGVQPGYAYIKIFVFVASLYIFTTKVCNIMYILVYLYIKLMNDNFKKIYFLSVENGP